MTNSILKCLKYSYCMLTRSRSRSYIKFFSEMKMLSPFSTNTICVIGCFTIGESSIIEVYDNILSFHSFNVLKGCSGQLWGNRGTLYGRLNSQLIVTVGLKKRGAVDSYCVHNNDKGQPYKEFPHTSFFTKNPFKEPVYLPI